MKIQIYIIPNCLSVYSNIHCADAKKKLQEKGIEFEELDGIDNIEEKTQEKTNLQKLTLAAQVQSRIR